MIGFNNNESFDMKITPTYTYERTRIHCITTVLKSLHIRVSANLVFILRDVLYKGYIKKASKNRRTNINYAVLKMYGLKYIIFNL
jgi:hypothetical protein